MKKTHCQRGHKFSGDNISLIHKKNGEVIRACRTCARARGRKYYKAHSKRLMLNQKSRMLLNLKQRRAIRRRYRARYPEKAYAYGAVSNAVKRGKLIRKPCEVCGDPKVHGHHHKGYDKPLDVKWLCVKHHQAIHKEGHPR